MPLKEVSIPFMLEYLLEVVKLEKHYYIWSNAMKKANEEAISLSKLKNQVLQQKEITNNHIVQVNSNIDPTKTIYEMEISDKKKKSRIFLIIFFVGWIIFTGGITLLLLSQAEYDVMNIVFGLAIGLTGYWFTIIGPAFLVISILYKKKARELKGKVSNAVYTNNQLAIAKQEEASALIVDVEYREQYLEKEQDKIFECLKESKKLLADVYSMNILPSEYRNLDAVCKIYNYLDSRRCDKIYGHGGAFDTYVKDRQWEITAQTLFEIKNIANGILDTQSAILDEAREANYQLKSINSHLESIKNTNAEIARNTAISATANKQTAENSAYLARRVYYNDF